MFEPTEVILLIFIVNTYLILANEYLHIMYFFALVNQ